MATLARHPARLAFRAARLAVYAVQTMNADNPDWTADLLAEWADCAFKVGLMVRPIMAEYYRLFDLPDRVPPSALAYVPRHNLKPQSIVVCPHTTTLRLSDGRLVCWKCLSLVGKLVNE